MIKALASPAADADVATLVDWLELSAFFDRFGRSRIDEITAALNIQSSGSEEDIAEGDAADERAREAIENEITYRERSLTAAYPFMLTDDGEVLERKPPRDRRGHSFYFLCLILSHVNRSPILSVPPTDGAVRDVRRVHFQIFATLAMAGHIGGPSISLGWPRADGASILEVVARCCVRSGTGTARTTPSRLANPAAKDGGIDVLGWRPSADRPPPSTFWFGQAASGRQWRPKSARDEHEDFLRDYYDIYPQCNYAFITISPLLIDDERLHASSRKHGIILDRTRAPLAALEGLSLSKQGVHVEEVDRAYMIVAWVAKYRSDIQAAR